MEIQKSTENATGPVELPNDNQAFAKKVEESKKAIQGELENVQLARRGRGRPRKHSSPQPEYKFEQASSTSVGPAVPAPNLSVYIKYPLIAVSKAPAIKYKCPELQLTEDEADACAEALNQVVQAWVPDIGKMDPKTASVVMAVSVFSSIGYQKYSILRQKQAMAPKPEKTDDQAQEAVVRAKETEGIEPENYFAQRQSVAV